MFGASIEAHLLPGQQRPLSDTDYANALPGALAAVESDDSDGDGFPNLVEIQQGTFPGDPENHPRNVACSGAANPGYQVCKYDYHYAFRKVALDFCGFSPSFAQMQMFDGYSDGVKQQTIDDTLTACLKSDLWRGKNGQLWELAHRKIRPIGSLKSGSEDPGAIGLADYYDDYNLYTWSQIDDHDAREVLTANYFVTRTGSNPTVYATAADIPYSGLGQSFVDTAHRAGNLTSNWTLTYFIMFTALPRTAAAQAYRGYLDLDIAKQEGLYPVAGEPKDYDQKGVTATLCTQCHATLDPLSYPFRNYNGLTGPTSAFGQYVPNRMETVFSNQSFLAQIPESGYIFNQPVNNLLEWAQTASNSDQFARATVLDYWKLLLGGPPTSDQQAEFNQLWQDFKAADNYSVDKMLHALIKTEAYGAP
ncbi:MAG: hypothetical protein QM723_34640 [Myxococcaceae bacterium]